MISRKSIDALQQLNRSNQRHLSHLRVLRCNLVTTLTDMEKSIDQLRKRMFSSVLEGSGGLCTPTVVPSASQDVSTPFGLLPKTPGPALSTPVLHGPLSRDTVYLGTPARDGGKGALRELTFSPGADQLGSSTVSKFKNILE